ncbi:ATP-binding protein [Streptomyces sp. CA-294286]|uniref:ATP-binding protein n=1 Tax=Streptomyces sp. CA-294286 TaxID=3240070 RepID=UPI003D8B3A77
MTAEGDSAPVVLRWNYDPRAVGKARAELGKVLAGWGTAGEVTDAATLVLSELLTNSLRHGRVPGRLVETRFQQAGCGGRGVRLEVHDASARWPLAVDGTSAEPDASGGRGLLLVGAVADRWGVAARNGPGKYVWAECGVADEVGERKVCVVDGRIARDG